MVPFAQRRPHTPKQQSPGDFGQAFDRRVLERCVRACIDCEVACLRILESHLAPAWVERDLPLIRLCIGCADACASVTRHCPPGTTLASVSVNQGRLRETLMACLLVSSSVQAECRRSAALDAGASHCARICGDCADQCRNVLCVLRSIEIETEGVEVVPTSAS